MLGEDYPFFGKGGAFAIAAGQGHQGQVLRPAMGNDDWVFFLREGLDRSGKTLHREERVRLGLPQRVGKF